MVKNADRPYGMRYVVKGLNGAITTEKWYANRSDRDRDFAALKTRFRTNLLKARKIGKL